MIRFKTPEAEERMAREVKERIALKIAKNCDNCKGNEASPDGHCLRCAPLNVCKGCGATSFAKLPCDCNASAVLADVFLDDAKWLN